MKYQLLALALAAGCLFQAQAIEPGKSQTLSSPDQVPEGLNAADWSSIRSAYSAGHTAKAASVISQEAYVKASNPGANDYFGTSVAVSGDTVVVGALLEDSSAIGVNGASNEAASNSGAASVFVRSGGIWSQQAYLKASNTGANDLFGTSVAISGDTIVVGASREDSSTPEVGSAPNEATRDSGAAYVFTRSGGIWSQQAYLKASNTGGGDEFGTSVAISGDTLVVGASGESSSTTGVNSVQNEAARDSGAAYVFVRSSGNWSEQAYLKASNTGTCDEFGEGDNFGVSVAVSGDTVVVGANGESSSTTGVNSVPNETACGAGAAYIFARSGGVWNEQAYLKASNSGAKGSFGYSVAVSGDTVVVGAYGESSSTTGVNSVPNEEAIASGAAYVFVRSGGSWSQQAYLKASNNTEVFASFGYSVAVSGDKVVVGAHETTYMFGRSDAAWSQQAYFKTSDTEEGGILGGSPGSIAISGDKVVVGASEAAFIFTPSAAVNYQIKVKVNKTKFGKVTGIGSYATGSRVTLTARPKKDRTFVGWYEKNKLISKKKMLVIKNLTANRSLVAKFK